LIGLFLPNRIGKSRAGHILKSSAARHLICSQSADPRRFVGNMSAARPGDCGDRTFDGRFVYDYELPRVVAFTATAATEFGSFRMELSMGLILLIVLVVLLLGGLPRWEYSRNWGYGPSGGLGLVLVIVLILLLLGRIPIGL
jgi:hypothetical protein